MLDYLEQLINEGKWEEALILAEELVQKTDNTVEDMVRINLALIAARTFIGEYQGVVTLGDHASGMAYDVGNWDAYLTICHYLAAAHVRLHQLEQAKIYWLKYIEHLAMYSGQHVFEIVTWFHLGVAASMEGDYKTSVDYYEKSKAVAQERGTARQVLGVNHALISAYMRLNELALVPRLLAQTLRYLRNNPTTEDWLRARVLHFKVRAEFALNTGRLERARKVAVRGLALADNFPEYRYYMHTVLASVAREKSEYDDMIRHLTSARVAAIRARRYDYEVDAAESLYQLIQSHPDVLEATSESASNDLPLSWFDSEDVKRP